MEREDYFYAGTNSIHGSRGLYQLKLHGSDGRITVENTAQAYNTGRILLGERGKLYALNEGMTFFGKAAGGVTSFQPENDGLKITGKLATGGQRPCSLDKNRDGTELYAGHFFGGGIEVLSLDQNGNPKARKHLFYPVTRSGETPAVHDVLNSPDDGYLLALELKDHAIHVYRKSEAYEEAGVFKTGAGTFPRQMIFGAGGKLLYVLTQRSSQILVYSWSPEKEKKLCLKQAVSTVPDGYRGANAPSALKISPTGKLLAAVNRISDHISLFRIMEDGRLGEMGFCPIKGKNARDLEFSSDGRFLLAAETGSDTLSSYFLRDLKLEHAFTRQIPSPAALAVRKGREV